MTAKELGRMFREAREAAGLSVEDAYAGSRIHPDVIKDIENGVLDRMNKIYLKSFLKKYSDFLKLDTGEILKKYGSISAEIPDQEYVVEAGEEERKETASLALDEKHLQVALVSVLSVILIILVIVLAGRVRAKFNLAEEQKTVTAVKEEHAPSRTTAAARKESPAPQKEKATTAMPVTLTLKADGEVWVKVKEGADTVYTGIMQKGDSRTWRSDGIFTVWTGKAERLAFVVNTRNLGKIASGVVKNIRVSSKGVWIGDSWATRL